LELNGRNFDNYAGELAGSGGSASRAETALFWPCAKPFLHPLARFAAHLIIEFPLMEFQNLHYAASIGL
jgi:hypothetical protein